VVLHCLKRLGDKGMSTLHGAVNYWHLTNVTVDKIQYNNMSTDQIWRWYIKPRYAFEDFNMTAQPSTISDFCAGFFKTIYNASGTPIHKSTCKIWLKDLKWSVAIMDDVTSGFVDDVMSCDAIFFFARYCKNVFKSSRSPSWILSEVIFYAKNTSVRPVSVRIYTIG